MRIEIEYLDDKKRLKFLEFDLTYLQFVKHVAFAGMHDTLYYGKPFRTLNVIDEPIREVLAIEIDTSLPAARVVRVLEQLGEVTAFTRHCAWTTALSFGRLC